MRLKSGSVKPDLVDIFLNGMDLETLTGVTNQVANEVMMMGAFVATKGIGEKQQANHMILVAGDKGKLTNGSLGEFGLDGQTNRFPDGRLGKLNRFEFMVIRIGEVQSFRHLSFIIYHEMTHLAIRRRIPKE